MVGAVIGIVLAALLAAAQWYLWRRLIRDVSAPGGWYRRAATAVACVLPVTTLLALRGREFGLPFGFLQVVSWPGYYWMAALLYLLLILAAVDLVRAVLALRGRRLARRAAREAAPEAAAVSGGGAAAGAAGEPAAKAGAPQTAGQESEGQESTGQDAAGPESEGQDAAGPEAVGQDAAAFGRRRFVARGVAIGAGLAVTGTLGYGTYAARHLTTKHVRVALPRLPRAAEGYRIAVVSDIHLGPLMGGSHCRRVVDAVNATRPDLITVVGDLVDAEVDDLRSAVAPMADLSARHGAYFVTGNHEYYVDTGAWVDHVRELGLRPLVNSREELEYFDLAGVNDVSGEGSDFGGPDYEAALGDRDPGRVSVLMAHQPVMVHEAADWGVDLQLSGHTHGGQLWPITWVAAAANPTLAGLDRFGDTQLYVSRGAGAWGPPVRVGADPDVTVVELRRA
ncbi:metallophosphoesterase [Streptomyces hoynatensis]|uniref:Metallophosphoesterase n=1 Tax=Streptomyces hoynatensis TaxID=1141874 RepID=A0A3A9ZFU5_9ACTN|nr:metallophosphoesterase [Streptomyces hoynatensis]RKN47251.1 metallophosphoesterase [Streptomyces hoynatensis]